MSLRPPPTIGDLVTIVWDRRKLAGLIMVCVAVPGLLYVLAQPRLYEASARLVVGESRRTVDFARDNEGLREYALVNTYRELLMSPGLLQSAVETAGAAAQAPFAGNANPGGVLGSRIRVLVNRDSWMLTVACKDEEPARAEQLLTSLIEGFFLRLRAQHRGRGADSTHFLLEQLAEARTRLAEANQREQEFRKLTGVISSDPRENHAYTRMREMQSQRADLDRKLGEVQSQVEQLTLAHRLSGKEELESLLAIPGISTNPAVIEHQSILRELHDREAQLGEKYLERHPRMLEIRAQMIEVNGSLATAVTQAAAILSSQLDRLRTESSELDTRLIEAETATRVYLDNLSRLAVLEQETSSRAEVVRHLSSRAAEMEVTANLDDLQVSLVDPAVSSPGTVGLPRTLTSLIALLGAAICGAATAVAADFLDRRLRGAAALGRELERPVLSVVPRCAEPPTPGASQSELFDEALRTLRTNLKFSLPNRRGTVLVVAPVTAGVGSSTIAAFLAGSIAAAGEQVLLVDADMRTPRIETMLNFPGGAGLSLLLIGEPGIAPVKTPMPNLSLLGVGPLPPNPSELLNSHCLPEWVAQARTQFDLVIIDAPSLELAADALVLTEHADGILLVARDEVTTLPQLAFARERLRPVEAKVIGAVLNAAVKAD